MNSLFLLTQSANSFLRPIARVLGMLMNGIYNLFAMMNIRNVALTIVIFTVIVYVIMLPLTIQQQKFSKMSQLMNPEIQEVQKKYRGKRDSVSMQKQNEETQAIYKKYGVRPSGSCVFLVIQFLILIPLYRVIYSVPGYVTQVKDTFTELVNNIMATPGYQNTMTAFLEVVSNRNSVMSQVSLNFDGTRTEIADSIIDVLYRCTTDNWTLLSRVFDGFSDLVVRTQVLVEDFTSFLGASIVYSPMVLIRTSASSGHIGMIFIGILIPVVSAASQFLSVRLMPQPDTGAGDQMGNSMRMMNYIMPLYSFFIVFFLPIGIGIYWIAGAVIRVVQQFFINRHYDHVDMKALLAENAKKAEAKEKKKIERKGVSAEQIQSAASINTRQIPRSLSERAATVAKVNADQGNAASSQGKSSSSKSKGTKSSAKSGGKVSNAPPPEEDKPKVKYKEGSMASLANKVTEYNERNSKSK